MKSLKPLKSRSYSHEDLDFSRCPKTNGLARDSAANVLQIRSLSTQRFVKRLGQVESEAMTEILAGLVICVDYEGTP